METGDPSLPSNHKTSTELSFPHAGRIFPRQGKGPESAQSAMGVRGGQALGNPRGQRLRTACQQMLSLFGFLSKRQLLGAR